MLGRSRTSHHGCAPACPCCQPAAGQPSSSLHEVPSTGTALRIRHAMTRAAATKFKQHPLIRTHRPYSCSEWSYGGFCVHML